jgi:hypothetical protein
MTSIADTFDAQLQNLKARSDESDKSIKEHLSKLYSILDEMEAIDKKYEQELREI